MLSQAMEKRNGQAINNHMHLQIQYGEIVPNHFCTIHKCDLKKKISIVDTMIITSRNRNRNSHCMPLYI